MNTREFWEALSKRGVRPDAVGISPEQDLFLRIWLDPHDGLTASQKLKRAGVSWTKYQAWMKEPQFRGVVERTVADLEQANEVGIMQLQRLVGQGDLNAIKFAWEVNNKHNPRQQDKIDVLAMMQGMLEIIARHVKDPETLDAIAQDTKLLAARHAQQRQIGA